jgi:hypothetical protein
MINAVERHQAIAKLKLRNWRGYSTLNITAPWHHISDLLVAFFLCQQFSSGNSHEEIYFCSRCSAVCSIFKQQQQGNLSNI